LRNLESVCYDASHMALEDRGREPIKVEAKEGPLNAYRQQSKEAEALENPKPEDTGPTLAETLADNKQSALFVDMLTKDKTDTEGMDLAEKLAHTKDLLPGDLTKLAPYNTKFKERIERANEMKARITEENIKEFGQNNPRFQEFLDLVGPEKMVKAVHSQMLALLINNEGEFNALKGALDELNKYRSDVSESGYKTIDDEIRVWCDENKVEAGDYMRIMQLKDPKERTKQLRVEIRESYNGFKRIVDTIGDFTGIDKISFARKEAQGVTREAFKTSLGLLIEGVDDRVSDIGGTLQWAIDKNPQMQSAVMAEITGDQIAEEKTGMGYTKMRESMDKPEKIDKDFEKAWSAEMSKNKALSRLGPYKKAEALAAFGKKYISDQEKSRKKEGGFWESILNKFINNRVRDKMKGLKQGL